jgi:DNA gyrase/topoisomerase IV subunit A
LIPSVDKKAPTEQLQDYSARSLKVYGDYVVEQRAIPDFRDGLKPIHRAILWAMYDLHLHHTGSFKKSARTVGDVLGRWHPHSDLACYQAMVGLVSAPTALVDGYGNWGDHSSPAGAARYTEARLSKFSDLFLLDSEYLEVSDMVWNFSEDKKMPLVLPAKLPVALLLGSDSIAFGVAASTPSFSLESVIQASKAALKSVLDDKAPKVTAEYCMSTLKFDFKYGGTCKSPKQDLLAFFNTGKGSLLFFPTTEKQLDKNPKQYLITSVCPGGFQTIDGIKKTLQKISELKGVARVHDAKDKRGIRYVISLNKNLGFSELKTVCANIDGLLLKSEFYSIGMTDRSLTGVSFFRTNVPDLLLKWAKWRISIEKKVIKNMAAKEKAKMLKLQLIAHAVVHIDIVAAALKEKDPETYLVDNLNISREDANYIRDLKFRQLESQDLKAIKKRVADSIASYKVLVSDYKAPLQRMLTDLDSMTSKVVSATSSVPAKKKESTRTYTDEEDS